MIFCDTSVVAKLYVPERESSDCLHLVTALHHQFSEIYTYDQNQSMAAKVLGLKLGLI